MFLDILLIQGLQLRIDFGIHGILVLEGSKEHLLGVVQNHLPRRIGVYLVPIGIVVIRVSFRFRNKHRVLDILTAEVKEEILEGCKVRKLLGLRAIGEHDERRFIIIFHTVIAHITAIHRQVAVARLLQIGNEFLGLAFIVIGIPVGAVSGNDTEAVLTVTLEQSASVHLLKHHRGMSVRQDAIIAFHHPAFGGVVSLVDSYG